MERAWGSVHAAVCREPLRLLDAVTIASQVASAVYYLHEHYILHGAIAVDNIMLLAKPAPGQTVIAKLSNFAAAALEVRSEQVLSLDVRARLRMTRRESSV